MNWTSLIRGQVEQSFHGTRLLIQKVDADKLNWKPATGSNWLTVGQLLQHLSIACGSCFRGFITNEWADDSIDPNWKPKEGEHLAPATAYLAVRSVDDALKRLDADKKTSLEMLARTTEKDLDTRTFVAPWGGPEMNLGTHFLTCVRHQEVHRSQLFYYLKLQGKSVGTAELWGMG